MHIASHDGVPPCTLLSFAREVVRFRGRLVPRHVAVQFAEAYTRDEPSILEAASLPAEDLTGFPVKLLSEQECHRILREDFEDPASIY